VPRRINISFLLIVFISQQKHVFLKRETGRVADFFYKTIFWSVELSTKFFWVLGALLEPVLPIPA